MDDTFTGRTEAHAAPSRPRGSAEGRVAALASYFENLDEALTCESARSRDAPVQDALAARRLGMASSLFLALRAKHAPTAAHSLRVALACSSWANRLGLPERLRDALEIAALLHDVGKIGIPDYLLMKPGKLVGEELLAMDRHRAHGHEILSACCESEAVLEVLRYSGSWFDGTRHGFDCAGNDLPLGTRMLAIVDAYDSMTTEHVYRRAMSRERAVAELFACAGTQFDPRLVKEFAKVALSDGLGLDSAMAQRWLREIQPEHAEAMLRASGARPHATAPVPEGPVIGEDFHWRLLENMHDGVFFVSEQLRVLHWNRAAERLTGIRGSNMVDRRFVPSLIQMRRENGKPIDDDACPVAATIVTGVQMLQRVQCAGRNGRLVLVNLHLVPVLSPIGEPKGAAVILHDTSNQVTLEERVQKLHERATQDPLTKVANRAEFDRVIAEFVETHRQAGAPCSLIICDIDHFKKINDVHGHQAGDEALVHFAAALSQFASPGDLVARYGGEEFVLLCASCDNAAATERAERARRHIASTPQSVLGGRCITASFGVSEIQGGDTAETLLRRADRALLQAKETGRNRVVQLGTGLRGTLPSLERRKNWLIGWLPAGHGASAVTRDLITPVPLHVAAEKLKGFISDHHAEIIDVAENHAVIKVDGPSAPVPRRQSDRRVPFTIRLEFREARIQPGHRSGGHFLRTEMRVEITPARKRDRRHADIAQRANQLLVSLKAYFMAEELPGAVSGPSADDGASRPGADAGGPRSPV
ncbi:MAG: diguanylate cyclase [Planctomycetes bacterium]|nr:diguanylate cyclase [Planctomycetota bacterium]